jgi:hypothetical protein
MEDWRSEKREIYLQMTMMALLALQEEMEQCYAIGCKIWNRLEMKKQNKNSKGGQEQPREQSH